MDVIDIIAAKDMAERGTETMLNMVINELMDGGTVRGSYLPQGGVGYDGTEAVSFSSGEQATLEGVYTFVKVSGEPLDLSSVTKIVHYENESEVESDLSSAHVGYGSYTGIEGLTIDNIPYIVSVSGENEWGLGVGLWFLDCEGLRVERVEYTAVHTIDPKYIPALDALVLNGADGKQYKVTVDELGALAVTAI